MRSFGLMCIVFLLSIGPAYAGRGGGGHGGGGRGGGGGGRVVVRDHRGGGVVRDHRGGGGMQRGPVHVRSGRYMFPGGVVRVYKRPVIRTHYYNVNVRPTLIVESYDPVPGYVWIGGNWRWGGGEWIWVPGSWSVDGGATVGISAGISIH